MAGFYTHGPTLTYVTDPSLSLREQQRVLTGFVRCAPQQMLRVAFRLPDASDDAVCELLEWYLRMIDDEGVRDQILLPQVHNRPEVDARYRETRLWLPARALVDFLPATAYSVHSLREAKDAFDTGARELIYGHVFESESHLGKTGRGIQPLKDIAETIRMDINKPIITAIGGIAQHTVGEIGRARIFNVACIRAISRSPEIARTLEEIRQEWVTALIDEDLDDPNPLAFDRPRGLWHRRGARERAYQTKDQT